MASSPSSTMSQPPSASTSSERVEEVEISTVGSDGVAAAVQEEAITSPPETSPSTSQRDSQSPIPPPQHTQPSQPESKPHLQPTASQSFPAIAATDSNDDDDDEPRKCWICYSDETEDDPSQRLEWRSPCPCALTAHESCLLDWVADLESPKSNRAAGNKGKILCPQCKSEIVIARPKSLVVDGVRKVERIAGRLVLPGVGVALLGTVWTGCHAHGMMTMYLIFGTEDTRRILGPMGLTDEYAPWFSRANLGLPLIPLALIGSRTKYLDLILPVLPVIFFATNVNDAPEFDSLLWPPSAAMTFTALPYVKGFYNALYERFFGHLERRWIAEVRPRSSQEDDNQNNDNANANLGGNDGDILVQLQMDIQAHVDHLPPDEEARMRLEAARLEAEEAGVGANNDINIGPNHFFNNQNAHLRDARDRDGDFDPNNLDAAGNGAGDEERILGRRQNDIIIETSNLADSILGALLMPVISAGVGLGLEYILPTSWVTPPSITAGNATTTRLGILQSKWGRSVVGGCLFVVLKDALVLYCRWKLVQIHRQRTVVDYRGKRRGQKGKGKGKGKAGIERERGRSFVEGLVGAWRGRE